MTYTVNVKSLIFLAKKWFNVDITPDQAFEIERNIYKQHDAELDYFIDEELITDCMFDVIEDLILQEVIIWKKLEKLLMY